MSRDHRSLHSAVTLLAEHGIEIDTNRPPRHRRTRADETVLTQPTELDYLVATLRMLCPSVQVIPGEPSGDCEDCDTDPRPATVEIYQKTQDGRRHDVRCPACAVPFVRDAIGWVWVEVLVP